MGVLTTAVIMWMVQATHVDWIWFGIFIVLVVEITRTKPPVGFNHFVVQGLIAHDISYVEKAPDALLLRPVPRRAATRIYPGIATWLPRTMFSAA
jgi:TRAP-type C4-dicarboxylate transport system permease large subunit